MPSAFAASFGRKARAGFASGEFIREHVIVSLWFPKTPYRLWHNELRLLSDMAHEAPRSGLRHSGGAGMDMCSILVGVVRGLLLGGNVLVAGNLALRQRLAILQRKVK